MACGRSASLTVGVAGCRGGVDGAATISPLVCGRDCRRRGHPPPRAASATCTRRSAPRLAAQLTAAADWSITPTPHPHLCTAPHRIITAPTSLLSLSSGLTTSKPRPGVSSVPRSRGWAEIASAEPVAPDQVHTCVGRHGCPVLHNPSLWPVCRAQRPPGAPRQATPSLTGRRRACRRTLER